VTGPRNLLLDIETSPNIAHVWGLFNQNVSLSQLRESTQVICFAAKWEGAKKTEFYSDFHHGHSDMVQAAHDLFDNADIVTHYNGKRFDMPHLRREFLLADLGPHRPVREVDLYQVVRTKFRFVSNKLEHVLTQLGLEGKVKHSGHGLWVRCMAGIAELAKPEAQRSQAILADATKAWAEMKRYSIGDVVKLEPMLQILKPWIHNYPHAGLYTHLDELTCSIPGCGGKLQRRGRRTTALSVFQQYQCQGCGAWSRGKTALGRVEERGTA